jgi:hypothetical protein
MYSENLRSFLRAAIHKTIGEWEGEREPAPIARHVLDVVLIDHEFTHGDLFEGLYTIIYDETCNILKGSGSKKSKPDLKQLLLWHVPQDQAEIIVEINRIAVYVPSKKAYKPLYGKGRIKRLEIPESVAHYKSEANCNDRIAVLLQRLFDNPGGYYK